MRKVKIKANFLTDVGRRRDSNQDSFLVDSDLGIYIVADGMGGHSGGEVASALAVETVKEIIASKEAATQSSRELLYRAFKEASNRIFDKAATVSPELSGMGTTMVTCYVRDQHIYIANVGDSRCYLFRRPLLWQLTEDHSLINEQIRAGIVTEEQAKKLTGRNVITRSVGYERDVVPDILERELIEGEVYLLCSDGLSGLVDDQRISEILTQNPPDKAAALCLQQALNNGGDDNVTVLVLEVVA